jgi:3-hydroxyacyl-CoA dehydrogenase/enoyl-CoA hydratase/carnithine racemase
MGTNLFSVEKDEGGIVHVTFDSGGLNTLTSGAIDELTTIAQGIEQHSHEACGVILMGNQLGLGAGADINELKDASREDLTHIIERGHRLLSAIEESKLPWLAVIAGGKGGSFALGGIYELALACKGIIATGNSVVGFPEIKLLIFPGLGGTQRAPRRVGLKNAIPMILQGRNVRAQQALEMKAIDAIIPDGADAKQFAVDFLTKKLPGLKRIAPLDDMGVDAARDMFKPMIQKTTRGRPNPQAPFKALQVVTDGFECSLQEGIELEKGPFLDVASSSEGKAGMRMFQTDQLVKKPPKGLTGSPRDITWIGVAGADGFMGNGIAFRALEAGYKVIAYVPKQGDPSKVVPGLMEKYAFTIKKKMMTPEGAEAKAKSVRVVRDLVDLVDSDLMIEALVEVAAAKKKFFREFGKVARPETIMASNSSSMGPEMIAGFLDPGNGKEANVVNMHFFGPADRMPLVEIIRGTDTSDDVVLTAHQVAIRLGKTPVHLKDGSVGFLVNAALAAYIMEGDKLIREGTPIDVIEGAMKALAFPMGPYEVSDMSGLDILDGMFKVIETKEGTDGQVPLARLLNEAGRLGKKSLGGFYVYDESGNITGVWDGLDALIPDRGDKAASEEEVVTRCMMALYKKVRELIDRGIVASEEEADIAFVLGLGLAPNLGGPIYYGQLQGWGEE